MWFDILSSLMYNLTDVKELEFSRFRILHTSFRQWRSRFAPTCQSPDREKFIKCQPLVFSSFYFFPSSSFKTFHTLLKISQVCHLWIWEIILFSIIMMHFNIILPSKPSLPTGIFLSESLSEVRHFRLT
jgi:hypothetical protein